MINMSKSQTSFTNRIDLLSQLTKNANADSEQKWDVIVVGGGIVGAGILQEATRRGLNALLIEQQDFAWGTSSRSSKMVHGGLRYIAQGDVKLTKHSLQERELLLKQAPGLINRMGYYFVVRKSQFPGRFIMGTLLSIYDWLAGIKDHKFLNLQETIKKFPGLRTDKLKGTCYYTDTVVDDSRLVMRVLQEAVQAGAHVLNYTKAKTLLTDPKTARVIGVIIEDTSQDLNNITDFKSNESLTLKSSVVINATGAWADRLRNEVVNEQRVRPLRGSHLVITEGTICLDGALTLLHPKDKRPVFIYPWEGVTVIGTTDLDHTENLDHEAKISQIEVDYLLEAFNQTFPDKKISAEDVISTWSGVRPVIASDNNFSKNASKEARSHSIWADNALITASGGKLTTFRLTAIEAVNAAIPWLEPNQKNKYSEEGHNDDLFTNSPSEQLFLNHPSKHKYKTSWLQRLTGRYGDNAALILQQVNEKENLIIGDTQFCLAECRWAIKNEAVIHLDDLLLRRTRLGLLLKNGAEELFPALYCIFQQELGWEEVKWQGEVMRYNQIWKEFYYLPKTTLMSSKQG